MEGVKAKPFEESGCDILLRGGRVIDPAHGMDGIADLHVAEGRIHALAHDLSVGPDTVVVDASGLWVMPGLVDPHVHLCRLFGHPAGHRMLARAGVTTALDMAGNFSDLVEGINTFGAGLTVGYLKPLVPGETIADSNPSRTKVIDFIEDAVREGAYGVKILGGHFPLTPEATRLVIEECAARNVHVAFHAGTTQQGRRSD
jgi:imidazolonepropionase-like amidohydrolase